MKTKPEEWKRLCHLVAEESDPKKLIELVEQLIGALDARKEQLEGPDRRSNSVLPTSTGNVVDSD